MSRALFGYEKAGSVAGFCRLLAGGLGFEPRLAESESAVLPLDDPPGVRDEGRGARAKE